MQCIKRVEEDILRLFLAREELDIIHNEKVDIPVEVLEVGYAIFLNCFNKIDGEFLA